MLPYGCFNCSNVHHIWSVLPIDSEASHVSWLQASWGNKIRKLYWIELASRALSFIYESWIPNKDHSSIWHWDSYFHDKCIAVFWIDIYLNSLLPSIWTLSMQWEYLLQNLGKGSFISRRNALYLSLESMPFSWGL